MEEDAVFGHTLPVLRLTGTGQGGYLQLPDGVLNGAEGVTVSFYCRIDSVTEYANLFSFGTDNCFYLSVLPGEEEEARASPPAPRPAAGVRRPACRSGSRFPWGAGSTWQRPSAMACPPP